MVGDESISYYLVTYIQDHRKTILPINTTLLRAYALELSCPPLQFIIPTNLQKKPLKVQKNLKRSFCIHRALYHSSFANFFEVRLITRVPPQSLTNCPTQRISLFNMLISGATTTCFWLLLWLSISLCLEALILIMAYVMLYIKEFGFL